MIKIETSIVINRPIGKVFTFVTDVEKLPQWSAELVEAKKTSGGPVAVSTTFSAVAKLLGRRMENDHEVSEYEPNSKFAFKVTSGPAQMEIRYTFESVAGGTKFTVVAEGETGGFFKLAEPIFARVLQRQYETNFANLKDLLEAQAEGSA